MPMLISCMQKKASLLARRMSLAQIMSTPPPMHTTMDGADDRHAQAFDEVKCMMHVLLCQ